MFWQSQGLSLVLPVTYNKYNCPRLPLGPMIFLKPAMGDADEHKCWYKWLYDSRSYSCVNDFVLLLYKHFMKEIFKETVRVQWNNAACCRRQRVDKWSHDGRKRHPSTYGNGTWWEHTHDHAAEGTAFAWEGGGYPRIGLPEGRAILPSPQKILNNELNYYEWPGVWKIFTRVRFPMAPWWHLSPSFYKIKLAVKKWVSY